MLFIKLLARQSFKDKTEFILTVLQSANNEKSPYLYVYIYIYISK